jgi:hypothetical protein
MKQKQSLGCVGQISFLVCKNLGSWPKGIFQILIDLKENFRLSP